MLAAIVVPAPIESWPAPLPRESGFRGPDPWLRQDAPAALDDPLADGGGLDRALGAVEELHPGLHLGSLDAAAEGRLRQVRTLGSATEVQFLGKKQYVLQMAKSTCSMMRKMHD